MSIMIDLPPAMAQEAREYAAVRGTTLERMVVDYLKMQLSREREADDVHEHYERVQQNKARGINPYKENRENNEPETTPQAPTNGDDESGFDSTNSGDDRIDLNI